MKVKTAFVSIYPVTKISVTKYGNVGHCTAYQYIDMGSTLGARPKTRVEFTTLEELGEQVRRHAVLFNETNASEGCVAWVRMEGRKPPGFDKAFREPPLFARAPITIREATL